MLFKAPALSGAGDTCIFLYSDRPLPATFWIFFEIFWNFYKIEKPSFLTISWPLQTQEPSQIHHNNLPHISRSITKKRFFLFLIRFFFILMHFLAFFVVLSSFSINSYFFDQDPAILAFFRWIKRML